MVFTKNGFHKIFRFFCSFFRFFFVRFRFRFVFPVFFDSKWSETVRKRSETVRKRSETVRKRSETVRKRSETVRKSVKTIEFFYYGFCFYFHVIWALSQVFPSWDSFTLGARAPKTKLGPTKQWFFGANIPVGAGLHVFSCETFMNVC